MSAPGSAEWNKSHYGDPGVPGSTQGTRFRAANIVTIDFCGAKLPVHKKAVRAFLHLEQIFKLYAPKYAAKIKTSKDDWGFAHRYIRDTKVLSNHSFGTAIDINAITNGYGTKGNMPEEVIRRAEASGFRWGGRFSTPDPMHFDCLLTPTQVRNNFDKEGRWK